MEGRVFFGFAFLGVFIFVSCGKREEIAPLASGVVVTNIVNTNESVFNPTGSVSTVIFLTNGIYFGSRSDNASISVDIPGHYVSWIYYEATNNKPRRMVHQFYGANRYWLTDLDGVPDTRVDYNPGPTRGSKSIFVKGEWIDAEIRSTNATAVIDQQRTDFKFSNGKWNAAPP